MDQRVGGPAGRPIGVLALSEIVLSLEWREAAMRAQDPEESTWLALSHLKCAPARFLALLADPVPAAKDRFCWLVRCNPLLQLRSALIDFDSDWTDFASFLQLRSMLEQQARSVTARGRLDCGIYTRKMFETAYAWTEIRQLAAACLRECELPDWPLETGISYRQRCDWSECEDELYSVLAAGGKALDLAWIRAECKNLWEPR